MNNQTYYESASRGTPDFPIELHIVENTHPAYEMRMHWHKDYEIIKVTEGEFPLILNDRRITVRHGESIVISGGTVHGGTPKSCKYQCVLFPPSVAYAVKKCELMMKSRTAPSGIIRNSEVIDRIFDNMKSKPSGYEFAVLSDIYALLGTLCTNDKTNKITPNPKIDKIKAVIAYIDQNYSSTITLDDLAKVNNMSPNYFCRFFKELTQETPVAYITKYRIERACELLISGSSVTDTAYICGFNDLSFFINTFKRHIGITPKKYQLQNGHK